VAERRGYLRIAARGKMGDADLDGTLDEGRRERLEALEEDKEALLEGHRVCGTLGLTAKITPKRALSGEGGALCATKVRSSTP
jgi:hypothetical protein